MLKVLINPPTIIQGTPQAPDYSGLPSSVVPILQSAIDAGNYEVLPDPSPSPDISPDWEGFNVAFLTEPNWLTIADLLLQDLRYGIVSTAANGNSEGLQSAVNIAKNYLQSVGQPLTPEVQSAWQAIADAHNIAVVF